MKSNSFDLGTPKRIVVACSLRYRGGIIEVALPVRLPVHDARDSELMADTIPVAHRFDLMPDSLRGWSDRCPP